MLRISARLGVLLILLTLPLFGQEELDRRIRGPLRFRNHFPLALHFLSFPGEDPETLGRGEFSWQVDLTTANTFVYSPDLKRKTNSTRSDLGEREFAALLHTKPHEDQFLFDGEVSRASLVLRRGLTDRTEVQIEIPYIDLGGGFLDATIEGFHNQFNIDNTDRSGYPQNQFRMALYLDGRYEYFSDQVKTSGFGDSVLTIKTRLFSETDRRPAGGLSLAVKAPTGKSHSLLSSGHTDYGANLLLGKHVSGQALYVNVGYIRNGGWWPMPELPVADVWVVLVALEHPIGRGSSLIVQQRTQSSVFAKATASELSSLSHELTVGIRTPIDRHFEWVLAFTENYGTFKSSPDIGVHLSVARRL